MSTTLDIPLIAYPTLTEAATLLAVSASTLSRREDLAFEAMGARDKRVPAGEVLRLAAVYRKRSINEVAADLLDYARDHAPDRAEDVEEEVERFFEDRPPPVLEETAFLAAAKEALPPQLYKEVERVYRMSPGTRPASIVAVERRPASAQSDDER